MAKKTINIHEAKTHFSRLITRVERGDEIVIARAGRPVARLLPLTAAPDARTLGSARGTIWIADDFDAPLPDDVLSDFER